MPSLDHDLRANGWKLQDPEIAGLFRDGNQLWPALAVLTGYRARRESPGTRHRHFGPDSERFEEFEDSGRIES